MPTDGLGPADSVGLVDDVGPAGSAPDVVDGLTRALARAARHLADAGRPQEAGRLAADGWVLLRRGHPAQAQRLDGAMHYAARLEQRPEVAPRPEAPQPEAHPDPQGPDTHHPDQEENPMSPTPDRIIDVRTEIPKVRHELIFTSFEKLAADTAFVLVNDHDPKPLYYQLAAENAGEFSWEYLEEGPEVWRVRIGRVAAA